MQTIGNTRLAAWRTGFLLYEDASLREVVADANRYFPEKIMLWSENLGELQVTASFQTDKIDSLVKSLDIALPLDVIRSEEGHIVLLPERNSGKARE